MKIKRKIYGALSIISLVLLYGVVGGIEQNNLNLVTGVIWSLILVSMLYIFSSPWRL